MPASSTVWVPMVPMRWNAETNSAEPTVTLDAAERWGRVKLLLEPKTGPISPLQLTEHIQTIRQKLSAAEETDLLVAVGDPAIMIATAGVLLRRFGRVTLLRWDRLQRAYRAMEICV